MNPLQQAAYKVLLPPGIDEALTTLAKKLGIDPGEVIRRALMLYQAAVDADKVTLTTQRGEQNVVVK